MIKFSSDEKLLYYEVSALKNEGINKMIFSVVSELQMFSKYNLSKDEIVDELERNTVLSSIKAEYEEIINKKSINLNIKPTKKSSKKYYCEIY